MFKQRVLQLGVLLAIVVVAAAWRRAAPTRPVDPIAAFAATQVASHVPDPFLDSWMPPAGIPAPDFGIVERAPAAPAEWNRPLANFYYIDATQKSATDDGNANGTPDRKST